MTPYRKLSSSNYECRKILQESIQSNFFFSVKISSLQWRFLRFLRKSKKIFSEFFLSKTYPIKEIVLSVSAQQVEIVVKCGVQRLKCNQGKPNTVKCPFILLRKAFKQKHYLFKIKFVILRVGQSWFRGLRPQRYTTRGNF